MTTIIVQARSTSTRLPRKCLLDFDGEMVLSRVYRRCADTGFPVVIAHPTGDKEIEEWCRLNKVLSFAGHPTNLTQRYYDAAKAHLADPIIRITSDCPFINTELIVLTSRIFHKWNGASGYLGCHFVHGLNVEIFDFATLEEATKHGEDEHCTTWMRAQPFALDFPDIELNTKEDYIKLLALCH